MFGAESKSEGGSVQTSLSPEPTKTKLMTPDEVARYFARRTAPDRDYALCLPAGACPMRLQKIRYWQDEPFRSRAASNPYRS
jgi:type IV secretory pathway TraG/TraD family ATPase VirD4